jgi:hypothetical protein
MTLLRCLSVVALSIRKLAFQQAVVAAAVTGGRGLAKSAAGDGGSYISYLRRQARL